MTATPAPGACVATGAAARSVSSRPTGTPHSANRPSASASASTRATRPRITTRPASSGHSALTVVPAGGGAPPAPRTRPTTSPGPRGTPSPSRAQARTSAATDGTAKSTPVRPHRRTTRLRVVSAAPSGANAAKRGCDTLTTYATESSSVAVTGIAYRPAPSVTAGGSPGSVTRAPASGAP